MSLDRKILEELKRFNQINTYILNEQPAPPAPVDPAAAPEAPIGEPEGGAPPPPADAAGAPPAEGDAIPEPVDVENDPDVEEVGNDTEGGEGESEEIDITDLVTTQQEIQAKLILFSLNFLLLHNKKFKLNKMSLWMVYFLS